MAEKEEKEKGITVKKEEDIAEWYSQVILKSEVADYAPVKGCMVIRPLGYSIWQNISNYLDANIKKKGVKNAYFPLFIPESFFQKEAEHAEGFKPEVAWVEKKGEEGERLAVRPTSETIMYYSYAKWIRSWRDLPLKINQWCNIVRWEVKDVKMFLRSREFLWQEGHCVYETEEERNKETQEYLEEYRKVVEDLLAVPILKGQKTENEKFAGADNTYTVESRMPDGKALQMGTSHDLSQGFAKAFGIKFVGRDENEHHPFQNSWGLSTRTIGALLLTHSDNKGLVLPPKVAPTKAVIVPIIFEDSKQKVFDKTAEVCQKLCNSGIESFVDYREEYSPGWKFNEWEMKGIPVRVELGPKDLEKESVVVARRDTGKKETIAIKNLTKEIERIFEEMQNDLFRNAKNEFDNNIVSVSTWEELKDAIVKRKFVKALHCGSKECEEKIKTETQGATTRCIISWDVEGNCPKCGEKGAYSVYFAKNY
ncbi:MAG: proline--tRNA ligase [Nanoarchaeota archaeon]